MTKDREYPTCFILAKVIVAPFQDAGLFMKAGMV